MPVLDATFLIDLDRDPERHRVFLRELAEGSEELVVPVQAAIEFTAGLKDPAEGLRKVLTRFTLAPADEAVALEAARLAKASFMEGSFPGWPDIQVAATARRLGMSVVTSNRAHFEPLGIEVVPYDV